MTSDFSLRPAKPRDQNRIWEILQQAIELRKQEGSQQWQDGYPNLKVVQQDIDKGYGYVLVTSNGSIVAYAAAIFDGEPAYDALEGEWLSNQDYLVIHRVAVAQDNKIKGMATHLMKVLEGLALSHQVYSIKIDTNFDNKAMLRILEKLGYQHCGKVYFRGSAREAFEKLLTA
ncbi:GNAT family N-acetyltransferase [Olivibacter ginsenosidimutans]|uniref:GNAT family N-acetyltransferase n=1 Tax=Olivibacter ginsenosidimutans TaxID=1176537 RepID=A0ABP9BVD0_9SPHI